MKRKHRRLSFIVLGLAFLGAAAALVLTAAEDNIVFFYSPSELLDKQRKNEIGPDRRLRIGGLVEEGSIGKAADGVTNLFKVSDTVNVVSVSFKGLLPDLFREAQGIVAEGKFINGTFVADEVLAKHDENYMPPEVADALKESGQWQHMGDEMKASAEEGGK